MLSTLLLAYVLSSQPTLTVTVKPGTPITITWDQPAEDTPSSFRIWVDGNIVKNIPTAELTKAPAPNADGSLAYTATAPGLPVGTHTMFVSAWNVIGESKGEAVPLSVGTAPPTPLRLKIVVTVGGGQ